MAPEIVGDSHTSLTAHHLLLCRTCPLPYTLKRSVLRPTGSAPRSTAKLGRARKAKMAPTFDEEGAELHTFLATQQPPRWPSTRSVVALVCTSALAGIAIGISATKAPAMKRAIGSIISAWDDSKETIDGGIYQCWWYTAGSCPAHAVSAGSASCGCENGYIGFSGTISKRLKDAAVEGAAGGAAGGALGSAIPVLGNAIGAAAGSAALSAHSLVQSSEVCVPMTALSDEQLKKRLQHFNCGP